MKSLFLACFSILVVILPFHMFADAVSSDTGSSGIRNEIPLLVDSITTQDDRHVILKFNQNIVVDSIRVRITRQSNGNSIKIDSLSGVTNSPQSVSIVLSDLLDEGVAYTIIIVSAISENAVIIRDGADALKEFTTPVPLKSSSLLVFNAPTSTSIITPPPTTNTNPTPTASTGVTTTIDKPVISNTTQELPLTGMNPEYLMFLAACIAGLLLFMRQRRV